MGEVLVETAWTWPDRCGVKCIIIRCREDQRKEIDVGVKGICHRYCTQLYSGLLRAV